MKESSADGTAKPKPPAKKRRWRIWLGLTLLLVVSGLGVSVYYWSYPVGLSGFQHPVIDRLDALERDWTVRIDERFGALQQHEPSISQEQWTTMVKAHEELARQLSEQVTQWTTLSAVLAEQEQTLRALDDELQALRQATPTLADQLNELRLALNTLKTQVDVGEFNSPASQALFLDAVEQGLQLRLAASTLRVAKRWVDWGDKAAALAAYDEVIESLSATEVWSDGALAEQLIAERSTIERWDAHPWSEWQRDFSLTFASHERWALATQGIERLQMIGEEPDPPGIWSRVRSVLGRVVTIRPRAVDALSEGEVAKAVQLLPNRLLLFEVALANRDIQSVRVEANALSVLVKAAFDAGQPEVQQAITFLDAFSEVSAAEPPAGLGQAIGLIENALSQP